MSPRKIRYVVDLVRRKPVPMALSILSRTSRRATTLVRKLIEQAVDSASKQHKTPAESLVVSRIFADGAGMMKRFRSMSMGRAGMVRKRLSHITVELELVPGAAVPAAEAAAPRGHAHPKREAKGKPPAAAAAAKSPKKGLKKMAGAR
jgi:large subunit ribosomal protein L22